MGTDTNTLQNRIWEKASQMAREEVAKIVNSMPSFKDIRLPLQEHHKKQGYIEASDYWLKQEMQKQWEAKARERIAEKLTRDLLEAYDNIEELKAQLENVESQVRNG